MLLVSQLLRFSVVDNGCGLGGKTSDELMTTFNTGCGAKTTTTNANGVVDTSKKAAVRQCFVVGFERTSAIDMSVCAWILDSPPGWDYHSQRKSPFPWEVPLSSLKL
jgi:hypothetical protein